ncbi:hypothetical protein V5P93_001832 [Actinokineospora auranticolor]|uniref:Alpha/beta hydrolase family protein n=1 Tax=Actinokineospora auranticolor TaxID=155976 RepID=A0A2S6GFI0_9PSEU|nr:hypothetical protein [Actinokineospora auranticolor]PPK63958.1 hypothetical protein CLV40_12378 [Actinokineospora auranticolor]
MPVAPITAVLVHSPFLGPATLRPLADELATLGLPTVLLDLQPSVAAPPVHQRMIGAFADAVSDTVLEEPTMTTGPLMLIGHSAAGPLLPAFADDLEGEVHGLLYLDADLPTPGQSWRDTVAPERYAEFRDRSRDGLLPRWTQWSDDDPLVPVTDPVLRADITDEAPEVPLAFLKETRPVVDWSGPSGYVALSAEHRADAVKAGADGWPVRELDLHHLACATDPEPVARAVLEVLLALRGE